MEKIKKTPSRLTLTKTLFSGHERVLVDLDVTSAITASLCFGTQFAGIFASMSPFGIAFYAAIFRQKNWVLNFLCSFAGIAVSNGHSIFVYAPALVLITSLMALFEKLTQSCLYRALTAFFSFLIFGFASTILSDYTSFDIISVLLEGMLVFGSVFMLDKGWTVIKDFKKRSFINQTESICTYIFMSVIIAVISNMPPIFGLNAGEVIAIVIIFSMCRSFFGAPALTLAVIIGAMQIVGMSTSHGSVSTYALGALTAYAFRGLGKGGVVLGFMTASLSASLLTSDSSSVISTATNALAASVIYALMPQKAVSFFSVLADKTGSGAHMASFSIPKSSATKSIERMAQSIGQIGSVYEKLAYEKNVANSFVRSASAEISSKICAGCKHKEECFSQKGAAVEAIKQLYEKDPPSISALSLPQSLRQKCHRCDSFAEAARGCAMVMKAEKKWLTKLNEARKLIATQLKAMSASILTQCNDTDEKYTQELEAKLWNQLDIAGVKPAEIIVRPSGSSYETELGFCKTDLEAESKKTCLDAVCRALGSPVRFAGVKRENHLWYLTFAPFGTYSATFGYATRAKGGQKVNGDSFNVICAKSSNTVMALSDGMGSGQGAKEESTFVIDMLEKFLGAGFDCETSAYLINSSLLLKGEKDSFSTLDICDINFDDATITFTKFGACASYIKTKQGTEMVCEGSLPAGIIKDIKTKKHMLPIESDTLVVLVSDGVADIALKDPKHEGWIEKELDRLWGANAQIVAAKLLEKATGLCKKGVHDDMTVLVGYIVQ